MESGQVFGYRLVLSDKVVGHGLPVGHLTLAIAQVIGAFTLPLSTILHPRGWY